MALWKCSSHFYACKWLLFGVSFGHQNLLIHVSVFTNAILFMKFVKMKFCGYTYVTVLSEMKRACCALQC